MKYITCPVCGQEYLPDELFVDLTGKHNVIEKTRAGKIDFYFGDDPEEETYYICDSCNSKFKVKIDVKFTTSVENESSEYITKIQPLEESLF